MLKDVNHLLVASMNWF